LQTVESYIQNNHDNYVKELKEFLSIPSVSAQASHKDDCLKAANFLVTQFESMGMHVELRETPGHPIVLARYQKYSDKPTLLIYGHYDVQPEDPVELWKSPPFEPRIEDEKIYARGATDDKGQVFAHVKAVEAHLKQNGELPVNVIFLIEGEEEIHSENLESFIDANKEELKADVAIISDSSQYAPGIPSILYGLRGICATEIRVTGANQDLHSGSFGGAVPNPAFELSRIIASMKDDKHHITIPGFYDDVKPLEDWERQSFAELPWSDEKFQQNLELQNLQGEEGFTTLERKWARPTLEINGIFGGYSGEGSKTVIPSWAGAKFTMRLVPHQDPKKILSQFQQHVNDIADPSVKISFLSGGGCGAVLVPRDEPFLDKAKNALQKGFGKDPVFIREGGSIPIVLTLQEKLDVNTLLIGFGQNDDNMHAPNEKFSLKDFQKGILTSAWLLHYSAE